MMEEGHRGLEQGVNRSPGHGTFQATAGGGGCGEGSQHPPSYILTLQISESQILQGLEFFFHSCLSFTV